MRTLDRTKNALGRKGRKKLAQLCQQPIGEFTRMGKTTHTTEGPMIHIDRGSKILGVAHLDYVMKDSPQWEDGTIWTAQLDDRLGVFNLLYLLPRLGMPKYDILLTDSEESGQSTARYFAPPKGRTYNWVFEMDRQGENPVCYQYEDAELVERLDALGLATDEAEPCFFCSRELEDGWKFCPWCGTNIY